MLVAGDSEVLTYLSHDGNILSAVSFVLYFRSLHSCKYQIEESNFVYGVCISQVIFVN